MKQSERHRAELERAATRESLADSEDFRRLPGGRRVKLLDVPKGPVAIEEEESGQRTPKSLQQDSINAELLQVSPRLDYRTQTKYASGNIRLAQKLDQIEHDFLRKRAEEAAAAAAV